MARIEPKPIEELDPVLNGVIAQAQTHLPHFMNQIQTLAHHPQIGHDLVSLYLGFLEHSRVDRRLIELAVLTVSYENRCQYCISHHTPMGLASGLSAEALADVDAGTTTDSPHFDDVEKVVIEYAKIMTRDARRVPSSLFDTLRQNFDNAQLVELTVRIGLANFFNRLNDALQIEIEPGVEALLINDLQEG